MLVDDDLLGAACELFCGRREPALMDRIAAMQPSPYELPYAFLEAGMPLASGQDIDAPTRPTERHVELAYTLLLQRHPESQAIVESHLALHTTMTSLLRMFFLGNEFRLRAPTLISRITPRVPRVWHVHIPKTGGTSIARAFAQAGWAVVNTTDLADPDTTIADLAPLLSLGALRRGVLFTGHQSLPNVLPHLLPFDACIAFVRHPVDRAVSFFNYMTRRLAEDPDRTESDTKDFFARGFVPDNFERTYAEGAIIVPNEQCAHLSVDRTARGALEHARQARCMLYDVDRVSAVLRRLLGMQDAARHNVSHGGLTPADVSPRLARRILVDNAEDLALFHAVRAM